MNTRLGTILYGIGLAGAALSLLYATDAIFVHSSGKSLLPIPGRYISREDMLVAISIGIALALLFWGAGAAARYFINKSAATQAARPEPDAQTATEQPSPPGPDSQ
jgi:hypothetical protein